jgi:penicillin-binding protein, 1A family
MKKESLSAGKFILRIFAVVFLLFFLFIGVYGIKGYNMYKKATKKQSIEEIIESVRTQEHFVSYEELPEIYIDAVISVEDKRFEKHSGIDIRAIGRAVLTDIKTMSMAEGGSTITQQLAKNLLFTQEKQIDRKFAEIFAAFAFEKNYSKKEIFEIYVNTIYFGSGYYGIYEASQGYFGKIPSELSDYESVMLAGIPNAPSDYSLDNNKELAEKRMIYVLKCMEKCEKITLEEAADILNQGNSENLYS